MKLIILAPFVSGVSGLCTIPSTSSSGGENETNQVLCFPKRMAEVWVEMANEGNDPDTEEFLKYRSAVLAATKREAKSCSYNLETDAYLGPESKLSKVALALLNGERPKERPDFRDWTKHALLVESCNSVCNDTEVA